MAQDFVRSAVRSTGGEPLIALLSTAKDGRISRIVDALEEGSGVVTTCADVRYVFIYVLPNFQNPTGVTLSLARRQRLVELASHYGQLRYEGEHLPPLVKLDAEFQGRANGERASRGNVLYLGTLSKTLAPGFRIGWVVAPEDVIRRLVMLKQGADLHTSTFAQMVACETARGGFLDRHVRTIRTAYRERRDAMLRALAEHFPSGVRWTRPQGGLFLWVTLPAGMDASRLLADALRRKVAFVPGTSFFPSGGGAATLRLNFSYCTPQVIGEGVRRLAAASRNALALAKAPFLSGLSVWMVDR